jgi:hypothetical protein
MLKKLRIPYFTFFMFSILMGCIKKDVNPTTNNIDIKTGLIAYYPFNGGTKDESGNGNHGKGYGVKLTRDRLGKNNKAYYFSAANCDTRIEANINTQSIKTGFTISFWMKSDWIKSDLSGGCYEYGTTLFEFCCKIPDYSGSLFGLYQPDQNYGIYRLSNFDGRGYKFPISNEWINFTFTYDGYIENWYQNGTLIGSEKRSRYSQPYLPGNAVFGRNNVLGFYSENIAYKGSMDEIRIYDKVLNEDQIKYLSTL